MEHSALAYCGEHLADWESTNFGPKTAFAFSVVSLVSKDIALFLKVGLEFKCLQTKKTQGIRSSIARMNMQITRK